MQKLKIKKNSNKNPKQNLDPNNNYSSFSDLTEGDISSSLINSRKFHLDSFKIELTESFKIKSSYKNINLLTEGEMIKNIKYKNFIESLIKKQYNKFKINDNNYKQQISLNSKTTKKEKKTDEFIKFYEGDNETYKDDILFSDIKLISFQKNHTNLISEESNNLSNKKEDNNYQIVQTFGNHSTNLSNKKVNQKLKSSSKFLERSEKNKK